MASMFNALHKLVIRHQPNPLYQTNNEIRQIPQRLGVLLAHPCKVRDLLEQQLNWNKEPNPLLPVFHRSKYKFSWSHLLKKNNLKRNALQEVPMIVSPGMKSCSSNGGRVWLSKSENSKIAGHFVLKPKFWEQHFESHYSEANVATDMGGNET